MEINYKKFIRKNQEAALEEAISVISHDIRNPVSSLKTGMHYLKGSMDDDAGERVKKIISISNTEIDALTSLLDEQREQVRRPPVQPENINFTEILDIAIEICNIPENIKLDNQISDPLKLKVDKWEIVVALYHLFNNAVQAIENNNGSIKISREIPEEDSEERTIIKITDNGRGINKKNLDKVTQIYFSTKNNSSGMGLTISEGIIKRHRGKLKIKSDTKNGTTVKFDLPLQT
ncbi:MAG: ATP-binding protein [Elusimicrobiota bacterium]